MAQSLGWQRLKIISFDRRATPLVIGGTQTQVLTEGSDITARALNHCAIKTTINSAFLEHLVMTAVSLALRVG